MPSRPNLLLITTDQQRADALGAAGNSCIRTPHLDWLCDTGLRFRRAYSESPVCVPARATMLTGHHYLNMPAGHGWFGQPTCPPGTPTLPGLLTAAGYQTRSIGKLHHHPPRAHHGYEHIEILEDYYRAMARHPSRPSPLGHGLGQNEMQPTISPVDEALSLTRWTVDRAVDFLETRDPTRPFFLHVGFSKPHPPLDPCLPYWLLYQNAAVPSPVYGDWSADPAQIPPAFMEPTWLLNGADRFTPELITEIRRAYYALVTQIDYNLGLLFSRLRELGRLKDTLIVFTSDHGEMLGDHHMGAKTTFLEASARVPLIVRPPDGGEHPRGTTSDRLACLADLLPTFLAAAGLPTPACDGLDLLAQARGEAHARPRILGHCGEFYAVIEERYKYLAHVRGGELLFDLAEDPLEQRELIRGGAHEPIRARMADLLRAELASRGLPLPGTLSPPSRAEVRARAWPGFHHPDHTSDDVLH